MRRGRALLAHPEPKWIGGRLLVSRQVIANRTGLHIDMVRRSVPAVACDVATRAWLVDLDEAEKRLAEKRRRVSLARDSA